MPGFLGFSATRATGHAEAFDAALSALAPLRALRESLVDTSGRWGIGHAHLGTLDRGPELDAARTVHAVVVGELEGATDVSPSARVLELYDSLGTKGLRRLGGTFAAAIVDVRRRSVILVCDRVGSYPIYYARGSDDFTFGSSLHALLRLRTSAPALDSRAVVDFLSFGFVLGTRTLARHVELVGPGCIITWSARDGVGVDRHAPVIGLFSRREQPREKYTADVVEAFGSAVKRATSSPGPVGMSLSGGLDSRAILSALEPQRGSQTYTVGVSGCADEAIARRLCALTGARFAFSELDTGYLARFLDHLRRMVQLTDGMYLSHGLTEMVALRSFEETPCRVLLRGHCGELAKTGLAWPLHTDEHVFGLQTTRQLIEHLLQRYTRISGGAASLNVFNGAWRSDMQGAGQESLDETLQDVDLTPPELCSYLYLQEHQRRFTVPSLELFRHAVEVRLPFLDENFLRVLLSGQPEWRHSTDLHRAIVACYDRRLLAVRDSNTGAPMTAGPLARRMYGALDTACRRLNMAGHRHYHRFERWTTSLLIDAVESQLLSDRSLDRGLLLRERLHSLLQRARRGEPGCAYVLQILLILELWQQQNVDIWYPPGPRSEPVGVGGDVAAASTGRA